MENVIEWRKVPSGDFEGYIGRRRVAFIAVHEYSEWSHDKTQHFPTLYLGSHLHLARVNRPFRSLTAAQKWCYKALTRDWSGL